MAYLRWWEAVGREITILKEVAKVVTFLAGAGLLLKVTKAASRWADSPLGQWFFR